MQYQRRRVDYISDESKQAAARSPVVRWTGAAFAVVLVGMFASLAAWFMLAVAGSELRHVAMGAGAVFACGALGIQFFALRWLVNR